MYIYLYIYLLTDIGLLHISISVCVFTEHNAEKVNFVSISTKYPVSILFKYTANIVYSVIRGRERETHSHLCSPFSYRFHSDRFDSSG